MHCIINGLTNTSKRTTLFLVSGGFCLFLIAANCTRGCELPATTHAPLDTLAEVNGKTQSIEHHVHILVPADSRVLVIMHVPCTSWWVAGAGHSCFATGKAGQALPYAASSTSHAAWGWGGEKKHRCWRPSVSLFEVNLILFLTVLVPQKMGLKDCYSFSPLSKFLAFIAEKLQNTRVHSQWLNTRGTKTFTFFRGLSSVTLRVSSYGTR